MKTYLSKIVCNVERINIDFYLHSHSLAQRNYDFRNKTYVKSDKKKKNAMRRGERDHFKCK